MSPTTVLVLMACSQETTAPASVEPQGRSAADPQQARSSSAPGHAAIPHLDQLSWVGTLRERYPSLMEQDSERVTDPTWLAIVLHPSLREEFLASGEPMPDFIERRYSPEERDQDVLWATGLRSAHRAYQAHGGIRPAGVNSEAYAGYLVGSPLDWRADGFVRKIYLTFEAFDEELGPGQLLAFAQRLASRGCTASFKVDLRPAVARFGYNQLIVYVSDSNHADCVEDAAEAHYGRALLLTTRGVDPPVEPGESPVPWNGFLRLGEVDDLPPKARAYLTSKQPR